VTTNHAESYFAQLKRSLDGTHHHVSVEHLDRYLAEFDFRFSTCKATDTERVGMLVSRVGGGPQLGVFVHRLRVRVRARQVNHPQNFGNPAAGARHAKPDQIYSGGTWLLTCDP
jgi:hypothetical protein